MGQSFPNSNYLEVYVPAMVGKISSRSESYMTFSDPELSYLKSQSLARLATVSKNNQPDVIPVSFEFDGRDFWIGGQDQLMFVRSHKYKNVRDGNNLVSITIDGIESVDPWKPRCVKIYGTAEILDHTGSFGPGKYLKVTPRISWSFGIEGLKIENGIFLKTIHR